MQDSPRKHQRPVRGRGEKVGKMSSFLDKKWLRRGKWVRVAQFE